jgi:hypothetical protein
MISIYYTIEGKQNRAIVTKNVNQKTVTSTNRISYSKFRPDEDNEIFFSDRINGS